MKSRMVQWSRWGWRGLAALYLSIFITIMVLAYTHNLPSSFLSEYDKAGHFVLYGIATYLGHRILNFRRIRLAALALPLFPVLFGIFTVVEEFVQSLSPYRTFDIGDLIASFLGIGLGYWLAEKGRR